MTTFYAFVYADGRNTSTSYRDARGKERYRVAGTIKGYPSRAERETALEQGFKRKDFRSSGMYLKADPVTVAQLRHWGFSCNEIHDAELEGNWPVFGRIA